MARGAAGKATSAPSAEVSATLPEGTEADGVRASYDAGILHITIPMPTKPKTKVKVAVEGNKQLES